MSRPKWWFGLSREWTQVDGDQIVGAGRDTLTVIVCETCAAVVDKDRADDHMDWHQLPGFQSVMWQS